GVVGEYEGNLDGEDTYEVLYSSPWLLLDPTIADALKILKEIPTIVQLSASASIAWQWEFDFAGQIFSETVSHVLAGRSEWGDAEFNVGEFSGGLTLRTKSVDGRGEGQFIRVGFRTAINGFDLVLQQIKLLFKLGRMAA